jgi:hypothetical protein
VATGEERAGDSRGVALAVELIDKKKEEYNTSWPGNKLTQQPTIKTRAQRGRDMEGRATGRDRRGGVYCDRSGCNLRRQKIKENKPDCGLRRLPNDDFTQQPTKNMRVRQRENKIGRAT